MNFSREKLPSSLKEIEWHWKKHVEADISFSGINIRGDKIDFTLPVDYFDLTDGEADKISLIGRRYDLFSQPVLLKDFELNVFGEINPDTQIGSLLSNIKHLRPTADIYGFCSKFKHIDKSVFCAITICYIDKDFGSEMEAAVIEISEDEGAYVLPVAISEETLDYFGFDDIVRLAYWLGNFWVGIQYELNDRPEEIRIIEQRGPIMANTEELIHQDKRVILVKRVIPIDEAGNEIKYGTIGSGRQYSAPVWGVRGHSRVLPDGRVIQVRPYRKGKERKNPQALVRKEYRFVGEKIDLDIEKENTEEKNGL